MVIFHSYVKLPEGNYLGGIIINLQDSYHDETSFWRPCVAGAQAAPSTKCSEEEVGEPW